MKLKRDELVIGQDDIFENDLMHRKEEVENLSQIITQVEDPLVLAINAPWGSGKTTFIKLLQANLKKEYKSAVIEINAWETDFADDPLIPILNSIKKWASTQKTPVKEKVKVLLNDAAPILKQTLLSSLKIATLGAFRDEDVAKIMSELSESYALSSLSYFGQSKDAICKLKKSIQNLQEGLDGNLVIFIDELDRCRPNYAIEVLERIKHLFSIDGVVFVLSIDQAQLTESIKSVYGSNFKSDLYLKRFIDLSYTPKNDNARDFIQGILSDDFFKKIQEECRKSNHMGNSLDSTLDPFEQIFYSMGCSLRDVNQIILEFKLVLMSASKEEHRHPLITLFLLTLRKMRGELYEKLLKPNPDALEAIKVITDEMVRLSGLSIQTQAALEALLYRIKYSRTETNFNAFNRCIAILNNPESSPSQKSAAHQFKHVFEQYGDLYEGDALQDILQKRIEFGASLKVND